MPHKRAKRSVREDKRVQSGNDLAPSAKRAIESEDIPKSVARVLNAAKIQQEWAERKRKGVGEDDAGQGRKRRKTEDVESKDQRGKAKSQLRIMPGESMAHFNRRVEDSMRHSVREAMQASSVRMRQVRKEELVSKSTKASSESTTKESESHKKVRRRGQADSEDEDRDLPTSRERPKEFETISTSAPKRLNDIVQAPPELKKLPRKAKKIAAQGDSQKVQGTKSLREGVLSMAQKAKMEEERERAIRLYREMKKVKISG